MLRFLFGNGDSDEIDDRPWETPESLIRQHEWLADNGYTLTGDCEDEIAALLSMEQYEFTGWAGNDNVQDAWDRNWDGGWRWPGDNF